MPREESSSPAEDLRKGDHIKVYHPVEACWAQATVDDVRKRSCRVKGEKSDSDGDSELSPPSPSRPPRAASSNAALRVG